ncbi:MAG: flagellar biosynthetic protein FliQ [Pikeienuella sp.]|uniref:flagellar biosynthetic protein FliQ n=1 Tax=Pikeienuella sp. TaxID=2831957 RepID=UPI0039199EEA
MSPGEIMDVTRAMLWVAFVVSLPILMVALLFGLVIGLFQALTSIQEMTLTFVPKLAAVAITFWISMGFMSEAIVSLWRDSLIPVIAGG